MLAGGRVPVPGSGSACPLGPQLPYALVGPRGRAADGAQGVGVGFAQGGAGSRSGEEGVFRPWELFSEMEGWPWPGGIPAFSHMPTGPPASVPLTPLRSRLEFPSLWCSPCFSFQATPDSNSCKKVSVILPGSRSEGLSVLFLGTLFMLFLACGYLSLCSWVLSCDPVRARGFPSVRSWGHPWSAQALNGAGSWKDV